jgi:hypothetical protein
MANKLPNSPRIFSLLGNLGTIDWRLATLSPGRLLPLNRIIAGYEPNQ